MYDWFGPPFNKYFHGKITRVPTAADPYFKHPFSDGSVIPYEEHEARIAIDVMKGPTWPHAQSALRKAFEYLDNRLTDHPSVNEPYRLKAIYDIFHAVRTF